MLKCHSCGQPPYLSLEAPHTAHICCDQCNTFETHTITASQMLSLETTDLAKDRLRKVECFLTLNASKGMGGEADLKPAPNQCLHNNLTRTLGKKEWTCDTCGDTLSSALFY